MNKSLLVRLGSEPEDAVEWLLWCAGDGTVLDSGTLSHAGHLKELVAKATEYPCYLLVPQSQTLVTEVQLPNRSRAALSTVPFQLEELLCDDPEHCHFAIGQPDADHRFAVVVVARSRIQVWSEWLREAALPVKGVFAEAQVMDEDEGHIRVLPQGERLLVKGAGCPGLSVTLEEFESWRPLLEKRAPLAVVDAPGDQPSLHILAAYLRFEEGVNLLQGAFRLRDPVGEFLKRWRLPAGLGVALLLLALASMMIENHRLKALQLAGEAEVKALFSQALPESRIVNPRVQMERALETLRQGQQGAPLLRALEKVAAALAPTDGLTLNGLRYERGDEALVLELHASDYAKLEAFNQALQAQGMSSQLGQFTQNNQLTRGQVSIQGVR